MSYGTNGLADLLAAQVPVVTFGEDQAFQAIQDALDAHNRIYDDMASDLVLPTDSQMDRYGGPATMQMDEMDEWGVPDAQKVAAGANIGYPLRIYGITLQWTRWTLEKLMTQELVAAFTAAQDADVKNLQKQLKKAIFTPTNSTFQDKLTNGLLVPVKAFLNADGQPVPLGPNGEVFNASTHTHYVGCATANAPTEGECKALIETVIEHYATGQPIIMINRAQEPLFRGFASFAPYYDNRVTVATTITRGTAELDPIALYNRPIGIFDGAVVWVKPWMSSGYFFAHMMGSDKPMRMRQQQPLRIMADNEQFPLRANTMARVMGIGIRNRANGAVLDTTSGSGTYTAPAITVV